MQNFPKDCALTCNRLMGSLKVLALTLQATSSWAVELATCLAEEISRSWEAWPWTTALAASHRPWVAAATLRAAEMRPMDHWPSSL